MKARIPFLRLTGLLLTAGAAFLASCQDDVENPAPDAKTQLLLDGPWHITAYTRTTGSGPATNYFNTVFPNACERDDRYEFKSSGVQERTEGPTVCGSGTSSKVVGTYPWDFSTDRTKLTIGGTTFDVVQLTGTNLQLRSSRTSGGVTIIDNISYAN